MTETARPGGGAQIEISLGRIRFSGGSTARVVFASRHARMEDVARALDNLRLQTEEAIVVGSVKRTVN